MSRHSFLLALPFYIISSFSYHLCHAKDIQQSDFYRQDNTLLASKPKTVGDIHLFQIGQSRYQTEDRILDEIEKIGKELDELEQKGHLDSAIKYAAAGVLGTIAYGIAHAQLAWYFDPSFYKLPEIAFLPKSNSWVNAMLRGTVDTLLPGLEVGAILGLSNYFPLSLPPLPTDNLILPAVVAISGTLIMTTGLFLAVARAPSFALGMLSAAGYTVPLTTIGLLVMTISARMTRQEKCLNLQYHLNQARNALKQQREFNQIPASND